VRRVLVVVQPLVNPVRRDGFCRAQLVRAHVLQVDTLTLQRGSVLIAILTVRIALRVEREIAILVTTGIFC
jgi:hypothetical protein